MVTSFRRQKKCVRAKTILEIIEVSKRVTINRDNEVIYVDKVPTGLKTALFLYEYNNQQKSYTLRRSLTFQLLST